MDMEIHSESDVVVAGGGPSGLIAALAAARAGARTLLVEQYGFLGGMATVASVGPFSPFHYDDQQITMGIPQELVQRLIAAGGSTGHLKCVPEYGSGSYMAYFDREVYKMIAFQMMEEAGVRLLLHTFIGGTVTEGNRVTGLQVCNKSGFQQVLGKVVVDATGDGDVAARAGAEFKWGRDSDHLGQPMTMFFEMANVDTGALKSYIDTHPDDVEWASELHAGQPLPKAFNQRYFVVQGFTNFVKKAREAGELHLGRDTVLLQSTMRDGTIVFNSTRVGKLRGTDVNDFTEAEIEGRKQAMSLAAFAKKYLPGFADAYVCSTGAQIGVRESRHVVGEYLLTPDDVASGRRFPDVVARGFFPIDVHDPTGGKGYQAGGSTWIKPKGPYDIPLRCLIPKAIDGLVMTGRNISASHEAHGSLRVQGTAFAIGQASGAAAAVAAKDDCQPRDVDVGKVQRILIDQKANLDIDQSNSFKAGRSATA
ncbi:FAD-dependent oxidoreductase [Telmatospirillum sp.]|uniref:FAD-dependent oxidoreductase n=1 Tax=Telmatospirillum sp. TaxID=2079197 RepID=UPI002848665B|nr:FAD-dependent oxidoreductase [Telmatospirillum sp.]MDR3436987.1 FAD-dependent oxidoreductase [Telmatospirillum sp.]